MFIKTVENIFFRFKFFILLGFAAFTVFSAYYAAQLRMEAGFGKQLPSGHEYINTFYEYEDELFGANRILIVLQNTEGDIWNQDSLQRLQELTEEIFFLPGVDRPTVRSIWTPNTRFLEITEEGIRADDVIPGDVTPTDITPDQIREIENRTIRGGHVGRLVSTDSTSAMVVADLIEFDPRTGEKLDYFELADQLESQIREKFEDEQFTIHIVGFAKLVGDIADGARSVIVFFALAFFLTALAVYVYSQSLLLTITPLFCSLVSLIWQFGILKILGYGLDPLAILVPFLVFAIGVSHGVQQINLITKKIEEGESTENAARASFSGLLIPGSMALVTDLVGFGTLYFIPITMIQELAVTASIGVALKILTNLIMLPLVVSYFKVDAGYVARVQKARGVRMKAMKVLGYTALKPVSVIIVLIGAGLFAFSFVQSQGRHIGDLHAGAPELRPDARYNIDSAVVSDKFSVGLNLLTVVMETPKDACIKYDYMNYVDQFSWHMSNVPGVVSVASLPVVAKEINAGWNEGNPKWQALP
ncbi:MAG: MMPL family transporter, partial [Pseudomonadota bacterium]